MLQCMRTSIDIPDALMARIRAELAKRNMTFREAVITGLRSTLLEPKPGVDFKLRDASFQGQTGFTNGFDAYSLFHALHTEDKGSRYANPTFLRNGRLRPSHRRESGSGRY